MSVLYAMSDGKDFVVKSLGYGVYIIVSATDSEARDVGEQIGHVLEIVGDPESCSRVVVLDGGHPTSKYEVAIMSDPEVSVPVRRASVSSPSGSILRSRLGLINVVYCSVTGEENGPFKP